jgi:hypothetical protein
MNQGRWRIAALLLLGLVYHEPDPGPEEAPSAPLFEPYLVRLAQIRFEVGLERGCRNRTTDHAAAEVSIRAVEGAI